MLLLHSVSTKASGGGAWIRSIAVWDSSSRMRSLRFSERTCIGGSLGFADPRAGLASGTPMSQVGWGHKVNGRPAGVAFRNALYSVTPVPKEGPGNE